MSYRLAACALISIKGANWSLFPGLPILTKRELEMSMRYQEVRNE